MLQIILDSVLERGKLNSALMMLMMWSTLEISQLVRDLNFRAYILVYLPRCITKHLRNHVFHPNDYDSEVIFLY